VSLFAEMLAQNPWVRRIVMVRGASSLGAACACQQERNFAHEYIAPFFLDSINKTL
jgi:hypothetical protein